MNTTLREIASAPVHRPSPRSVGESHAEPAGALRAVETDHAPVVLKLAVSATPDAEASPEPTPARRRRTVAARAPVSAVPVKPHAHPVTAAPAAVQPRLELGAGGLRLAFCLCGLRNALLERQARGERLSEREILLLAVSAKQFAEMRPLATGLTLGRLDAIVTASDLGETNGAGAMEIFALSTLRTLSERARHLLTTAGPDAALSLFGDASAMADPLAIFEVVFSASLDIVEAFEKMIPGEARLLSQLAESLDSEIEKI